MDPHTLASRRRGLEAAFIASVPQVLLPHAEQRRLDPPPGQDDASIGPRLIQRLAQRSQQPLPGGLGCLGASSFHFGYAALRGALYALAYEKRPIHPLLGGVALDGAIHAITLPRRSTAVRTKAEPPPGMRSGRESLALATAAFSSRLGTPPRHGRGPGIAGNRVAADRLATHRTAA